MARTLLDELLTIEDFAKKEGKEHLITETYQVIIQCESEDQQRDVHEVAEAKGWKSKLITI